ncbi:hotdog fold domain-containing protein [Ferrimonas pelagia]|uniref:Hotdog fold domain-containing protein n=1 Tax=Ferrimonas pelagia TaxID=1177826 RepID=A0ABP9EW98_9GAMM
MSKNYVLSQYKMAKKLPFGDRLFARAIAAKAPYFKTVGARVVYLEPHHCECVIKKRRAVENHIGTVHVIAICNGLELAMGVMAEASIPRHLRWIPKGMSVDYTGKAGSDIRCVAQIAAEDWKVGDLQVPVTAYDQAGKPVVQGHIKLWISEKPAKTT